MRYFLLDNFSAPLPRLKCNPVTAASPVAAAAVSGGSSILGSVVGGIINAQQNRANRRWAEKMYQIQLNDSIEEWNREFNLQNDYNSPSAQMQRLRQAGLNPNLMMDNGNVGNASMGGASMPSASSADQIPFDASGISQSGSAAMQSFMNAKLADSEIAAKAANTRLVNAQAEVLESQNPINLEMLQATLGDMKERFEYNKQWMPLDVIKKRNEVALSDMNITFASLQQDELILRNSVLRHQIKYMDDQAVMSLAIQRQNLRNMVLSGKLTVAQAAASYASAAASYASANLSGENAKSVRYDRELRQRTEFHFMATLANDLQQQALALGQNEIAYEMAQRVNEWDRLLNSPPEHISNGEFAKHLNVMRNVIGKWMDNISPLVNVGTTILRPQPYTYKPMTFNIGGQ